MRGRCMCLIPCSKGPDAPGLDSLYTSHAKDLRITIHASVLALQGQHVVSQPIVSSDGSIVLLWNGEVFESALNGFDFRLHDGEQLLDAIWRKIDKMQAAHGRYHAVAQAFSTTLSAIDGPYAVVLLDVSGQSRACGSLIEFYLTVTQRCDILRKGSDWSALVALCSRAK